MNVLQADTGTHGENGNAVFDNRLGASIRPDAWLEYENRSSLRGFIQFPSELPW